LIARGELLRRRLALPLLEVETLGDLVVVMASLRAAGLPRRVGRVHLGIGYWVDDVSSLITKGKRGADAEGLALDLGHNEFGTSKKEYE
jgi:hypothetical protein